MAEINVQDEQGNLHIFPDGSTPEMIAKAMGVKTQQAPQLQAAPQPSTSLGDGIDNALAPNPQNYQSLWRTNSREVPKTLGREIYSGIKTIAGMPSGIYHAVADEPTLNEAAAFGDDPAKRIVGRLSGLTPAVEAGVTYADPKTRPTFDQALSVLPEALGQGAGNVVGGKLMEMGGQAAASKLGNISPTQATAPVRAAVRGANKALAKAPGTIGGAAGALVGGKLAGRLGAEIGGAVGAMAGKELLPQVQLPWENVGLPKTVEGGPKVAPQYEAPATPDFLQAKAYRARSAGEQGVPYNPKSHAQATASLDQARTYAEPGQRDAITGKPQEVVGVDLSQAPGFSVVQNGGNPPWVKFHGEVPESAVNTEVAAPDFLNTKKTVNKIGDQIEQGLGGRPLEPNVPLRQQGKLPQGFTSHESSALSGSKFNPQASELEIATPNGHYIYGEVTPEAADNFANAESKGKAWGEIKKNHPLVAKVINGKRVSVNPARK